MSDVKDIDVLCGLGYKGFTQGERDMSTEFTTKAGDVVATRFNGGKARGVCFQMEVTEVEWPAWRDQMVAAEGTGRWVRFEEAVAGATVMFDNAPRQNEMARQMEAHRFPMCHDMAPAFRQRARDCARQQMRGR